MGGRARVHLEGMAVLTAGPVRAGPGTRRGPGSAEHGGPGTTPSVRRRSHAVQQQLAPLPAFDGNHVVLGAWTVGDESAGLGIRESSGLITDEYARFLPHVIL